VVSLGQRCGETFELQVAPAFRSTVCPDGGLSHIWAQRQRHGRLFGDIALLYKVFPLQAAYRTAGFKIALAHGLYNLQMEPTRPTVRAIMSPRRAAHLEPLDARTRCSIGSASTRRSLPKKFRAAYSY